MGHRSPLGAIASGGKKTKRKLEPQYEDLPQEVRAELHEKAEDIRLLFGKDVESMLAIGNVLNKVKDALLHGQWLTWLGNELKNQISPSSAASFMRAQTLCADYIKQGKIANFANLSRSSMHLIAGPDVPEEVQHQILERSSREPVPYSEVKNLVDEALEPIREERRAKRAARGGGSGRSSSKGKQQQVFTTTQEQRAEFVRQVVIYLELDEGLFGELLALGKDDLLSIFTGVGERIYGLRPPAGPAPWDRKEESTVGQPFPKYFGR